MEGKSCKSEFQFSCSSPRTRLFGPGAHHAAHTPHCDRLSSLPASPGPAPPPLARLIWLTQLPPHPGRSCFASVCPHSPFRLHLLLPPAAPLPAAAAAMAEDGAADESFQVVVRCAAPRGPPPSAVASPFSCASFPPSHSTPSLPPSPSCGHCAPLRRCPTRACPARIPPTRAAPLALRCGQMRAWSRTGDGGAAFSRCHPGLLPVCSPPMWCTASCRRR